MNTRVVGVGQRAAGDDSAGLAVLELLKSEELPEDVELIEVHDPAEIVELAEGVEHLVVVDAVLDEKDPGRVRVLFPDALDPGTPPISSHGVGVARALGLAAELHPSASRRVNIVGIGIRRPKRLVKKLSPEIKKALPVAAWVVRDLVEG